MKLEKKTECGPILLSKLGVIKNQQFVEYIMKRPWAIFARCTAIKKYKGL